MSRGDARTGLALMAKVRNAQLATLVKDVPHGAWMYELKWDGYRIFAHKSGRDTHLFERVRKAASGYGFYYVEVTPELVAYMTVDA